MMTCKGVDERILSRQRWRRKYATEKNKVKNIPLVRYNGNGNASEAFGVGLLRWLEGAWRCMVVVVCDFRCRCCDTWRFI